MKYPSRSRLAPTDPGPCAAQTPQSFTGLHTWNEKNESINPYLYPIQLCASPTSLETYIELYARESRPLFEQAAEINRAAWEKFFNSEARDPEFREANQEKLISQAKFAKEMQSRDPALAALAELNAQPKFIRQPLQQKIDYLRSEQGDSRANIFLVRIVKSELARLSLVCARQQTLGYRYMARHEGFESLLILPELMQDAVKSLAINVANYMDNLLVNLCKKLFIHEDSTATPDELLQIYQTIANEAARLCIQPPAYHALLHTVTRRSAIPYDLIPGALARLRCADWWYRNLWALRSEWRETQLRAVGLVHKHASVYISHDALLHKREQRRKALEFFRAQSFE